MLQYTEIRVIRMLIEKTIRDYLNDILDVPVVCERPEKKPVKYVLVEKTNDTITDRLYDSHIVIQSNADTMWNAMTLDERIREILDANDIPDVSCKLEGSYNYTDTASKIYRYQSIFNVYHY